MKTNSSNSKELILECALKLFSDRGYDAVGISEITEAAGITKPTLYYFFGSKEGLYNELLKTYYTKLDVLLSEVCEYVPHVEDYNKDVNLTLFNIAEVYFSFAEQYPEFYLMSLALTFAPPTSHAAMIAEQYHKSQYELLEKVFVEISNSHNNIIGKEKISSQGFLAMVNAQIGFWYRGYANLGKLDAKTLVQQFMHGIFS